MPVAPFQLEPGTRNDFLIARDLGMTVEQMGEAMSVQEYFQWLALYAVETEEHERAMKRAKDGKR